MPASPTAALLALCLLGMSATAQPASNASGASIRPIELTSERVGEIPEVFISPDKSTTLTFDAELLRTSEGKDTVALEKREAFALVDPGMATLRLIPSDRLKPGERLRLKVRFRDGAVPSGAELTLVVHATEAERVVEVYRDARSAESYRQEAKEARAETAKCHAELERTQAEYAGPGGLRSLLSVAQMDTKGIQSKDLTEIVTKAPGNALLTKDTWSYRSVDRVAVDVKLSLLEGAQPFLVDRAALTGRRGVELKVLPVWSSGAITADAGKRGRVVVEAEATADEAQGAFTLKLWEAGTGRTLVIGNVTFP